MANEPGRAQLVNRELCSWIVVLICTTSVGPDVSLFGRMRQRGWESRMSVRIPTRSVCCLESRTLEVVRKMGGNLLLKLNIDSRPIANKYREGKVKRTLERELKVSEIAEREANETSLLRRDCGRRMWRFCCGTVRVVAGLDQVFCSVSCRYKSTSVGYSTKSAYYYLFCCGERIVLGVESYLDWGLRAGS